MYVCIHTGISFLLSLFGRSFGLPFSLSRYPLQQKYLEGDAAQWLWFVPGDPDGLRALFPSNQTYLSDLEELFNKVLHTVFLTMRATVMVLAD